MTRGRRPTFTDEQRAEGLALLRTGMRSRDVAERMNLGVWVVMRWRREGGIARRLGSVPKPKAAAPVVAVDPAAEAATRLRCLGIEVTTTPDGRYVAKGRRYDGNGIVRLAAYEDRMARAEARR